MAGLSRNAKMVLKRFLIKDSEGHVETPEGMFRRVARDIAAVDKRYGGKPKESEVPGFAPL